MFSNNTAYYTGTIDAEDNCNIAFNDNAPVTFNVTFGMIVFSDSSSKIIAQGNFNVTFNNHSAKWCNNTCLPYTGRFDSTVIDSDGIVWCNNQRGIHCSSDKCNCKNLEDIIHHAADINAYTPLHVNISDDVVLLSSQISLYNPNISIMGHNNPTVLCANGGRLLVPDIDRLDIVIKDVAWIGCGFAHSKSAASAEPQFTPAVLLILEDHVNLIIQKCSFQYSFEQVIYVNYAEKMNVTITDSKFENSGTIQSNSIAVATIFLDAITLVLTLKNCHFDFNEGNNIVYIENGKHYITDTYVYLINSIFSNNKSVSVKLKSSQGTCNCTLYIAGEVLFENNVAENGAGISIIGASTVIFGENSNVTFVNNSVDYNGAAMYLEDHSYAIFESRGVSKGGPGRAQAHPNVGCALPMKI